MDGVEYQPFMVPPVVLDAMILIDDVLQGLRNGRSTALRRVIAVADGRVSVVVIDETRKHLPHRAIEAGLNPDVAMEVFESSYLPLLTVGQPSEETSDDPRVRLVAARDPNDVETAQLVVSLAPAVCLTRDNDLLDYGLGTADWLDLVLAIEDVADFRALLEGTFLFSHLVGNGLSRALRANPWLLATVVGVLAVVAMRLPDPAATLLRTRRRLAALGHFYLEFASKGVVAGDHIKSQLVLPLEEVTQKSIQTGD